MNAVKKLISFLLILLLALPLAACNNGAGATIRYDIPADPQNLDPQFATTEEAKLIIRNTFEGLFRQNSAGETIPALVQSYEVSQDELTWTFTLREGLLWQHKAKTQADAPLTAGDFVFALERLFDPDYPSAYAGDFGCIKNAGKILNGELPKTALGVKAPDARTLIIELSHPAPYLPQLLSGTAAMPCNEAFYRETRGRYGLAPDMLLTNGPFLLYFWEETEKDHYLQLRPNGNYHEINTVMPSRVTFYIQPAQERYDRFAASKTDGAVLSQEQLAAIGGGKKRSFVQFEDTVWVLLFNQNNEFLQNRDARLALSGAVDRAAFAPHLASDLIESTTFLPPSLRLYDESYRKLAGFSFENPVTPTQAKAHFSAATALVGAPEGLTLLTASHSSHPLTAAALQKAWRDNLSLRVRLSQHTEEELLSLLGQGQFDIALLPMRPDSSRPEAMLGAFGSDSPRNTAGYQSEEYDKLLAALLAPHTKEKQLAGLMAAENKLYEDAVLLPMYFQTHYYAMGKGVSGIDFSPFAGDTDFRFAAK